MVGVRSGRIFASYRRAEATDLVGRSRDSLGHHFGERQVFVDVTDIAPSSDFPEETARAVGTCEVLLAIIGPQWLEILDQRHRDRSDDFVRLEIEAARQRGVRVIPILVNGAAMPTHPELPVELKPLADRTALELRSEDYRADLAILLPLIEGSCIPLGSGVDVHTLRISDPLVFGFSAVLAIVVVGARGALRVGVLAGWPSVPATC